MSVFKRLERYVSAFFKLGRISRDSKRAARAVGVIEPGLEALRGDIARLSDRLAALEAGMPDQSGRLDALEAMVPKQDARLARMEGALFGAGAEADSRTAQLTERAGLAGTVEHLSSRIAALGAEQHLSARAYSDLSRRLDLIRFERGEGAGAPPGPAPTPPEGLDALMEAFYNRLEDRFRGSREAIRERLRVYLPDIRAAAVRTGRPVFDLGCGRGEWVELLAGEGIAASGMDLNPLQIAEAPAGLDVAEGDALAALAEAPDGAYGAITAHHLVEHLPFDRVVWMTREALRCLAPGGVLLYETPNPRNLIVGATTFHIDPTHRSPMPAEVLTTLLDTVGFHPVESRPLHPSETRDKVVAEGRLDADIAELLFGPQDLAVLATKPAAA